MLGGTGLGGFRLASKTSIMSLIPLRKAVFFNVTASESSQLALAEQGLSLYMLRHTPKTLERWINFLWDKMIVFIFQIYFSTFA